MFWKGLRELGKTQKNWKNIKSNLAVAEIIGSILMLGITTSIFTVIYYDISTAPTPTPAPIVEISGKMDNNQIVLMHHGGAPIDLDTELVLNVGGKSKSFKVGDLLDSKSKEDGNWDFSEKLVYNIDYDFNYSEYPKIDINILDGVSNSLLMTGIVGVDPICDIGVEMIVDNQFPGLKTNIIVNITVTNHGNINASGIKILFNLPEGLTYYEYIATQGFYTDITGVWDVGMLCPGHSAVLSVEAIIGKRGSLEDAQLVLLLDGSGSIARGDWTLQVEGLASAVENGEAFPHDGSVGLTVIQFGGGNWNPRSGGFAKVEIGPIVIDKKNYKEIADEIRNIPQLGMMTPTACGIYMGADTVFSSSVFAFDIRQIVMIVTDGDPTQGCDCDGDYQADDWISENYKVSAEVARDYLISKLGMTIDQDEFNAIAVGESAPHASWLKENIVWPDPGYFAPPFLIGNLRRGWVRNVSTWEEFAETIEETFGLIFNQIKTKAEVSFLSFKDPKEANDFDVVTIVPTSSSPVVITKDVTGVNSTNATVNMFYNFKLTIGSGSVRFAYKIYSNGGVGTWRYTPWESQSGSGYYSYQLTSLLPATKYKYRAELQYDSTSSDKVKVYVEGFIFKTKTL